MHTQPSHFLRNPATTPNTRMTVSQAVISAAGTLRSQVKNMTGIHLRKSIEAHCLANGLDAPADLATLIQAHAAFCFNQLHLHSASEVISDWILQNFDLDLRLLVPDHARLADGSRLPPGTPFILACQRQALLAFYDQIAALGAKTQAPAATYS